jgi:hypothetical protein
VIEVNRETLFGFSVAENSLPGFREWLFCPGMLFQAADKWWGKRGIRERRHEGLDLLLYLDQEENVRHIDETFEIPLLADGKVVAIIKDFLGESIIVEHPSDEGDSGKILSMYGHTSPHDSAYPGVVLKKGGIIASVAGPGRSSSSMTPHLHLTIARARTAIAYDQLNWSVIGASDMLLLLDPLEFIGAPYRIAGDDHPACD